MKFTHYLKLSFAEAREHPLYATIYVAAVAMSVMLTMVFAIYYYIQLGPVYPETNRSNLSYIYQVNFDNTSERYHNRYRFTPQQIRDLIYPLTNNENVSAVAIGGNMASTVDETKSTRFSYIATDAGFFDIYHFKFLYGQPFTPEEFQSEQKVAVITDRASIDLFGGDPSESIGKTFMLEGNEYRVTGIVKAPSRLVQYSYADAYLPYTAVKLMVMNDGLMGPLSVVFETKNRQQLDALREELETAKLKFHDQWPEWELNLVDQPVSTFDRAFSDESDGESVSLWKVIEKNLLILFALILLPAVNLSGMIAGRMESRVGEMGIRKSFGARRNNLMMQIFTENLLMTLAGALIGLACAWLSISFYTCQVLGLFRSDIATSDAVVDVTPDMLFSPTVFGIVMVVILIISLLSAIIPSWISLSRPIVESLNQKR